MVKAQQSVDWAALCAPWTDEQVTWRYHNVVDNKLRINGYIKADLVTGRLNEVLTRGDWGESYRVIDTPAGKGIMCRLGIWDPKKKQFVPREGGGLFSEREKDKERWAASIIQSAQTLAFRRAALGFGIGFASGDIAAKRFDFNNPPENVITVQCSLEYIQSGVQKKGDGWFEPPTLEELGL